MLRCQYSTKIIYRFNAIQIKIPVGICVCACIHMCVEIEKPTLKCIEKYKGRTQNNQDNLERKIKLEDKIQQDDVSLAQG